ncbi:MAG: prolipoprotein diacylglyceryl transferase [Myxococcales bacterium]|nr:prolipoprotein diacylglyceryl transferase [Myxococcales bacterium]
MHQILLEWKVPQSWYPVAGPGSWLFSQWKLLAVLFGVAFVAYLWATDPERTQERRAAGWLTSIASLVLGGALAMIGAVYLGELKLHTYGAMISLGFIFGIALSIREGRRVGIGADRILDLAFWILIASMAGSRILFIITEWNSYWADLQRATPFYNAKLFRVWEGGLVFHGGLIGGLVATLFFVRSHKMNFFLLADVVVPTVALGQFFGRLGCFSAGCCYGKPCDLPWAVSFPTGLEAAAKGHIHPTQLYEALATLAIFFAVVWIRRNKRFHGQALVGYLLLYACVRFFIEIFRGDISRGFLFEVDFVKSAAGPDIFTWGQMISVGLFVLGLLLIPLAKSLQKKSYA